MITYLTRNGFGTLLQEGVEVTILFTCDKLVRVKLINSNIEMYGWRDELQINLPKAERNIDTIIQKEA